MEDLFGWGLLTLMDLESVSLRLEKRNDMKLGNERRTLGFEGFFGWSILTLMDLKNLDLRLETRNDLKIGKERRILGFGGSFGWGLLTLGFGESRPEARDKK